MSQNETPATTRIGKEQLVERLLSVATTAEAVAKSSRGGVGKIALLGFISAGWLAYYFSTAFELKLANALLIFALCALPAILLTKMYLMLRGVMGLPSRVSTLCGQVSTKVSEIQDQYLNQTAASAKSRFSELQRALKTLREVRSYREELGEAFSMMTGAITIANPVFAVLLMVASAGVMVLTLIAFVTALIFLF